ncbi:MAG TPA: low molecular weight protein arginine phosphatase [Anaerolineales bacterium]|nr:low molecular weight protein arginine phosphatase [Anaerolineales bacterium]
MPKILFICTANICRSPMAAAMFERLVQDKRLPGAWTVASAGTWARDGMPASENGTELMQSWGMDTRDHRSRIVSREILESADLILTMEKSHKEALRAEFSELAGKVFLLSEMAGGDMDIRDPYGGPMKEYEDTAREIAGFIEHGLPAILQRLDRSGPPGG